MFSARLFEIYTDNDQRKLTLALVKRIMTLIKPYIDFDKLPDLAKKLAEMARGQGWREREYE